MTEPSASTTESWDTSAQAAPATPAYAQPVVVEQKKESKADMRGVLVTLGGGIEGYTGSTRDLVRPGASYGVSAAIKPSRVFGIELGYSGAVNEFRGEDVAGADIVRNGGHLLGTFGLTASAVQPYLLGGVGISHYNVRGSNSLGLRDDTNGAVPLGAGLRTHIGSFTADLRGTYNVMFDQNFAPTADRDLIGINNVSRDGRYQGILSLGAMF